MFCFNCGGSMPDDSQNCPQCGRAVKDAPQVAPPPSSPSASAPGSTSPGVYASSMQPGYGRQEEKEGKATASMIFGILSVTCCGLFAGIPAIILGHMSKSNIRQSMGRLTGDGMATAGLVMGYISLGLTLIMGPIYMAIVIPSMLRAKMAGNEAGAAGTVRTLNTAQSTYSTFYPTAGYARSLVVLGAGEPPVGCTDTSENTSEHACLIDKRLGCAGGAGCIKNGYNFSLTGLCSADGACTDYVVLARPINSSTGIKSYCSTSDSIIRSKSGEHLSIPSVTVEECKSWPALE